MALGPNVTFVWFGQVIKEQASEAIADGTIEVGDVIVQKAKGFAHQITGKLQRSIHVGEVGRTGDEDEGRADTGDIPNINSGDVQRDGMSASVDVGSWVEYAAVEEISRGHVFMTPAVEGARGEAFGAMAKAFAARGLS